MTRSETDMLFEHTHKLRQGESHLSMGSHPLRDDRGRQGDDNYAFIRKRTRPIRNTTSRTKHFEAIVGNDHEGSDSWEDTDSSEADEQEIYTANHRKSEKRSRTGKVTSRTQRFRPRPRSTNERKLPSRSDDLVEVIEEDEVDDLLHEWTTLYDDE